MMSHIIINVAATRSRTRRQLLHCGCFSCSWTHLTFGSDAYVTCDRRLGAQVDGLLDADVSQRVFSKDRTSVKVGSHKAAEARQSLMMEGRTVAQCFGAK